MIRKRKSQKLCDTKLLKLLLTTLPESIPVTDAAQNLMDDTQMIATMLFESRLDCVIETDHPYSKILSSEAIAVNEMINNPKFKSGWKDFYNLTYGLQESLQKGVTQEKQTIASSSEEEGDSRCGDILLRPSTSLRKPKYLRLAREKKALNTYCDYRNA